MKNKIERKFEGELWKKETSYSKVHRGTQSLFRGKRKEEGLKLRKKENDDVKKFSVTEFYNRKFGKGKISLGSLLGDLEDFLVIFDCWILIFGGGGRND